MHDTQIGATTASPLEHLRQLQRSMDGAGLKRYLAQHPELAFAEEPALLSCLAVCHLLLNQPEEARHCLQAIDRSQLSEDPEALADYALALCSVGEASQGLGLLEDLRRTAEPPVIVFQRLGGLYLGMERLADAAEAFDESLKREPNRPEILSNLGGLKFREGDLDAALDYYNRAIALRPELAESPTGHQRARVLVALERVDELVAEKEDQLAEDPEIPSHHLQLATALLQAERLSEAQATLDAALDRFPEDRAVRMAVTQYYFRQKLWWSIGLKLKEWSEADADDLDYRLLLNQARIENHFLDAARTDLEAIADLAIGRPKYAYLQAQILIQESRAHEALELLEEACTRFPGDPELRFQKAEVLTSLGQLEEAEELINVGGLQNPSILARKIQAAGSKASEEQIEQLDKFASNPQLDPSQRSNLLFILAGAKEKKKEYKASFEAALEANRLISPQLGYNWKAHRRQIERLIQTFTPELVARFEGIGHKSNRPIFITGMPRSGTTLSEQILCSHPWVYGAGELPWITKITALVPTVLPGQVYPEALHNFEIPNLLSAAEYYLGKIAEQNGEAQHVVDKMPHNFDHIGLIALIFPNAAIIHLKREDRDVAISNFYQNFAACHGLMGFAYSLEDIGHMLNDHRRIMEHWHQLFPGRIFELDYQELVSKPEVTIRQLLEHCKLPWDDNVLKFYETSRPVRTASIRQVRQGIYTSSADKWRRYEEFLAPLEEVLAQGFIPLGEKEQEETAGLIYAAGPTR